MINPGKLFQLTKIATLVGMVSVIAACGGGGGGGSENNGASASNNSQPTASGNNGNSNPNPQAATFSASLSWNIPDTRENGEVLEVFEVGGYELQYKLTSDPVYSSILIRDGSQQRYEITNLQAGTYQFRMASFDTSNLYSEFTAAVSATFGS